MKKQLRVSTILVAVLLVLAGCAVPNDVNTVSSRADVPNAPSAPGAEDSGNSENSARSGEARPGWDSDFKQGDFLDFFSAMNYGVNISFLVENNSDVQAKENTQSVCFLMTNYLYQLDAKNNRLMEYDPATNQPVYPVERMERLSNEMFGFVLNFDHTITLSNTRAKGYINQLYPDNWRTVGIAVDGSLDYSDGAIRLQVDYWRTGENGNYPTPVETREFLFEYQPDSALCPYRLVSVMAAGSLLNGTEDIGAPTTTGVIPPDNKLVRPPQAVVYATGGLNLRMAPDRSTTSELLIPDSSFVQVLGCEADDEEFTWLYIDYNGEQGWVSREYVYQYLY